MSPEFITAAKIEEAELNRKLSAVRAMLAAYGEAPAGTVVVKAKARAESHAEKAKDQFTAYGWQVVKTAVQVVREASELPIKTRAIADGVKAKGVEIRGQDAANALGALLTRCSALQSHGKRGWTLTASSDEGSYASNEIEAPSDEAAGASTDSAEGIAVPSSDNRPGLSLVG